MFPASAHGREVHQPMEINEFPKVKKEHLGDCEDTFYSKSKKRVFEDTFYSKSKKRAFEDL